MDGDPREPEYLSRGRTMPPLDGQLPPVAYFLIAILIAFGLGIAIGALFL